jgi:ATPase, P-type (transporting), HAD superfamily, subfamily IC
MEKIYTLTSGEVINKLKTNGAQGLAKSEVVKRTEEYGKNEFEQKKPENLIKSIGKHLTDISTIILLVAAVLSFILAINTDEGFIEPIVIMSIVILNTILGITQERSAEKSLEALANLNTPSAVIIRESIQQEIKTIELVPGDIVVLKTGDYIPADCRLIESVDLYIDESSLTGESETSEKDAMIVLEENTVLGDRINMVFSGCYVTAGRGLAVVTETGMNTQMGKIAGYLNNDQKLKTPLQIRLAKVSKLISYVAIISSLLLLATGLLQGEETLHMIVLAVTLAVAAVPETLALIVTLTLSNGVKKMVKKNAIIKKLEAVETLGSVSVICSDKTGTLTQNKMAIKEMWTPSEGIISVKEDLSDNVIQFVEKLCLASNAVVEFITDEKPNIMGDATESSIMRLMIDKNMDIQNVKNTYERVKEIPFSSSRKKMTVILKDPLGGYIVLTKGALDWIPLRYQENEQKRLTRAAHDSFAEKALRVISLAARHIDELPADNDIESVEKELELLGLIGIMDPPRAESASAIARAKKAGIRTVMITGDHVTTAKAIAKEIGILGSNDKVMTGAELEKMSDEELCENIRDYAVYARVTPEDKIRIVEAWQENDEVVAMTGDGVNDAPALKAADVGIAMGINGTEVAKSAADMVLTDDNFATIIDAVKEGRNVFSNIRKTIYFLLVCNLSEIIIMVGSQLLAKGIPVTAIMLLLINVIGDGIPGLQLAKEESDSRLMDRKPIGRNESFFNDSLIKAIARQTIVCSVVVWVGYYVSAFLEISQATAPSHNVGQSVAFLVLGWTSIIHIFTVRSRKSVLKTPIKESMPLVYSAVAMIILFAILVAVPAMGNVFYLNQIGYIHWLLAILLSFIPILVAEIGKWNENREFAKIYKNRLLKYRRVNE